MHRTPLLVLLAALLAAAGRGATDERLTPEQTAALRAAGTVAVEIRQSYPWVEEETDAGAAGADKDGAENMPQAKPPRDILPLAEITAAALAHAGWKPAAPGEAADVRLVIETFGQARGGEYAGTISGYQYSGARLSGFVTLLWQGQEMRRAAFSGEIQPPVQIGRLYSQPWDAPFQALLPDFLEALYGVEESVFGLPPVIACLRDAQGAHSTAAARVLFARGDTAAQLPLLEALRAEAEPFGAVAAAGLGVFGDAGVLPALLEALSRAEAATPVPTAEDEHDLTRLTTFEHDAEDRVARAVRAREVSQLGRADALQWALLQNPTPDKVRRLAAVLGDRQHPALMRCRVALVLGRLRDSAADEALLAALWDEALLVRAAAVSALGNHPPRGDRRVVEALFALTTDPQPFIRRRARAISAQTASEILTGFLGGKYGRNAQADEHVEESLAHPDALIRLGAVHSLSLSDRGGAALGRLLQSEPAPAVREAVVEVLARRPGQEARLVAALADADEATRLRALEALDAGPEEHGEAEIEKASPFPEAALVPLIAMLDQDNPPEAAGRVLSRVRGDGVDAALLEIARREGGRPALCEMVLIELGRRGVKPAGPLLVAQLSRPISSEREYALVEAATRLDDPAMLDPLIALLRQGPPVTRRLAARVLGGMSHPKSVGPLIAALRSAETEGRNEDLLTEVRDALHHLTGREFDGSGEWLRWWKENAGKPIVRPPAPDAPPEEPAADEPREP
jgi:HEAT repeat protein